MNLKNKVGIILIAFSVLLYFAGYFFLVEHIPKPLITILVSKKKFPFHSAWILKTGNNLRSPLRA